MAGEWESQPDAPNLLRGPHAWRRCACGVIRFCRDGTRCDRRDCGLPISMLTGEPAPHRHEVAARIVGQGDYRPPPLDELRQYEGPHD